MARDVNPLFDYFDLLTKLFVAKGVKPTKVVQCNFCKTKLICTQGTVTPMKRHLKSFHEEAYNEYAKKWAELEDSRQAVKNEAGGDPEPDAETKPRPRRTNARKKNKVQSKNSGLAEELCLETQSSMEKRRVKETQCSQCQPIKYEEPLTGLWAQLGLDFELLASPAVTGFLRKLNPTAQPLAPYQKPRVEILENSLKDKLTAMVCEVSGNQELLNLIVTIERRQETFLKIVVSFENRYFLLAVKQLPQSYNAAQVRLLFDETMDRYLTGLEMKAVVTLDKTNQKLLNGVKASPFVQETIHCVFTAVLHLVRSTFFHDPVLSEVARKCQNLKEIIANQYSFKSQLAQKCEKYSVQNNNLLIKPEKLNLMEIILCITSMQGPLRELADDDDVYLELTENIPSASQFEFLKFVSNSLKVILDELGSQSILSKDVLKTLKCVQMQLQSNKTDLEKEEIQSVPLALAVKAIQSILEGIESFKDPGHKFFKIAAFFDPEQKEEDQTMEELFPKKDDTFRAELNKYNTCKEEKTDDNVAGWWFSKSKEWPSLTKAALSYLAQPASILERTTHLPGTTLWLDKSMDDMELLEKLAFIQINNYVMPEYQQETNLTEDTQDKSEDETKADEGEPIPGPSGMQGIKKARKVVKGANAKQPQPSQPEPTPGPSGVQRPPQKAQPKKKKPKTHPAKTPAKAAKPQTEKKRQRLTDINIFEDADSSVLHFQPPAKKAKRSTKAPRVPVLKVKIVKSKKNNNNNNNKNNNNQPKEEPEKKDDNETDNQVPLPTENKEENKAEISQVPLQTENNEEKKPQISTTPASVRESTPSITGSQILDTPDFEDDVIQISTQENFDMVSEFVDFLLDTNKALNEPLEVLFDKENKAPNQKQPKETMSLPRTEAPNEKLETAKEKERKETEDNLAIKKRKETADRLDSGKEKETADSLDIGKEKETADRFDSGKEKETADSLDIGKEKETADRFDIGKEKETADKLHVGETKELEIDSRKGDSSKEGGKSRREDRSEEKRREKSHGERRRDRSRSRERKRDRSRSRERKRDRSRSKDRRRERTRSRERKRDRSRSKDRRRERTRSRERQRDRKDDYRRDTYRAEYPRGDRKIEWKHRF